MPDPVNKKLLLEMVKTFQIHRHSKTCRKYRNQKCRFHFVKFFSDRRIVAEPLPDDMLEEIKESRIQESQGLVKQSEK